MGVDSLPPHGLHQLLIWSVDNYHFESQIVIWATSLLFVPETPAHFIRWAVIHLGLSVEGGILAAITRTSILLTRTITTTWLEIFNQSNDLWFYNMQYWDIQSQQWSRFCSSRGAWVVARDQPSWPGFDRCHQDNVAIVNLQRFYLQEFYQIKRSLDESSQLSAGLGDLVKRWRKFNVGADVDVDVGVDADV